VRGAERLDDLDEAGVLGARIDLELGGRALAVVEERQAAVRAPDVPGQYQSGNSSSSVAIT
jgi:hypothetical protein